MKKWKKFLLYSLWLPLSLLILFTSLKILNSHSKINASYQLVKYQTKNILAENNYQFYASLPQVLGTFTATLELGDARPELIRLFLDKHESPLVKYAAKIVTVSDKYEIDYRLITSIAMCESNLGKKMPDGSFNAWGYAIYTGENSGASFVDWDEAIDIMGKYLKEKYYNQGLTTPEAIGPVYAPPSATNGNSWAKCVKKFMTEML